MREKKSPNNKRHPKPQGDRKTKNHELCGPWNAVQGSPRHSLHCHGCAYCGAHCPVVALAGSGGLWARGDSSSAAFLCAPSRNLVHRSAPLRRGNAMYHDLMEGCWTAMLHRDSRRDATRRRSCHRPVASMGPLSVCTFELVHFRTSALLPSRYARQSFPNQVPCV